MKLTCSSCGAVVAAVDINVDTGIAKCGRCDEVMNVFERLGLPAPGAGEGLARRRGVVPRPMGMKVSDAGLPVWSVRWRWFAASYFYLMFFCIGWDGFLIFWYVLGVRLGQVIMLLFPVLHVAAGIGLTYTVIAGFLNSTVVSFDGMMLSIRHGPVYWRGNRDLVGSEVDQLYCKLIGTQRGSERRFELWVTMRTGGEFKLLGLPTLSEARFLEQQIEMKLRIEDRPMVGECGDH